MKLKIFLFILLFFLYVLNAEVICKINQPVVSNEGIELSYFNVEGSLPVRVGDEVKVSFKMENKAQQNYTLGNKGIFISSLTPDNVEKVLYSKNPNSLFKEGEEITITKKVSFDKEGKWKLWPSYHLVITSLYFNQGFQQYDVFADKNWVDCSIIVEKELPDKDKDGVLDSQDNCPSVFNPEQKDTDKDGVGDACDNIIDSDNDGIPDEKDKCPLEKETYNKYKDKDGCPDKLGKDFSLEITPKNPVPGNKFTINLDSEGRLKESVILFNNNPVMRCFSSSLCSITLTYPSQTPSISAIGEDFEGNYRGKDLQGNLIEIDDNDDDGDGIINSFDNCRDTPNPDQEDKDRDGVGDACDLCSITMEDVDSDYPGLRVSNEWDYIDENGCGYKDSDIGLGYYTKGEVLKQKRDDQISCREEERYVPGLGYRTFKVCFGNNYEVVGEDTCTSNNNVREYYLEDGEVKYEEFRCYPTSIEYWEGSRCVEGACTCSFDTDGGMDFYTPGYLTGFSYPPLKDSCENSTALREYFTTLNIRERDGKFYESCYYNSTVFDCPGSCIRNETEYGEIAPESCSCKDSDEGINFSVKGGIGEYEDYCIDDRTLKEYYPLLLSGATKTCSIREVVKECEGLCSDGKCLEPTCFDGIQNQGEEGIDCGSPCEASCSDFMVKGRILYEEADAFANRTVSRGFKPARFVKVWIMKGGSSLGRTITDSEGYFYKVISRSKIGDDEIKIKVKANNYAARVEKDFDGANEYIYWISNVTRRSNPEQTVIDFGELRIGKDRDLEFIAKAEGSPVRGGAAYFNIAETILTTREYIDETGAPFEDSIPQVDVQYPDTEWNFYSSTWEEITLTGINDSDEWLDFGYVDETISHEFGHHVQASLASSDVPEYVGEEHTLCGRVGAYETAFSEGFANYIASIVYLYHRDPSDPKYLSSTRQLSPSRLENGCINKTGYSEGSVLQALWDIADNPSNSTFSGFSSREGFDRISNETFILKVLDGEMDNFLGDAPDICEMRDCYWPIRDLDDILNNANITCSETFGSCGGS